MTKMTHNGGTDLQVLQNSNRLKKQEKGEVLQALTLRFHLYALFKDVNKIKQCWAEVVSSCTFSFLQRKNDSLQMKIFF